MQLLLAARHLPQSGASNPLSYTRHQHRCCCRSKRNRGSGSNLILLVTVALGVATTLFGFGYFREFKAAQSYSKELAAKRTALQTVEVGSTHPHPRWRAACVALGAWSAACIPCVGPCAAVLWGEVRSS